MLKSKKPLITIAIPTYNREEVLVDTVNYLLNNQTDGNFKLMIIDQTISHKEATKTALKSIVDSRFRYFHTSPPSLPTARNFALEHADTEYVLFLDDDIKPDKDLIKILNKTIKEKPGLGAIAGRVLQDGFPIKKEVLKFDSYAISHGVFTATNESYTNAFPGGNCTLNVKKALELGGFDTRYKGTAFREESDMALRMANADMKIFYQPKAEILHLAVNYGGTRVKTHIYDNLTFYKNELFFTLRFARKGYKFKAVLKKYREYCLDYGKRKAPKRTILYLVGLITAIYRIFFVKQIKSVEILE